MKKTIKRMVNADWFAASCRMGCTLIVAAGLLLLSCSGTSLNAQRNGSQSRRQAPADLNAAEAVAVRVYQDVLSSVVTIYTEKMVVSKDAQAAQRGLGSGVVISADGHILTAAHVVDRAERIAVKTSDGLQGGEFPGRFMGRDFLFGGDLILDFNTEEVCTEACLLEARRNFQGKDKIPIKYLRNGKIHTTVIDITDSRRNYLK